MRGMASNVGRNPRNYRIGVDVGTHSVGLAAIEFDEFGRPNSILSAVSWIHDSGVLEAKTGMTRLAAAGMARRVRRLRRRRAKRLVALDKWLADQGWSALPDDGNPYLPWLARKRLATERVSDETLRNACLATALRHVARHRGWRNPYVRVSSLYQRSEPSKFMVGEPETGKAGAVLGFKQRVEDRTGLKFDDDVTIAELAIAAVEYNNRIPLRAGKTEKMRAERDFSYISGKLMQSDNANEIHTYARTQGLSDELTRQMIDLVFASESPRGSWLGKVGKDPLNDQPRALKASDAFQRFRIVSTLANVRIKDVDGERRLHRDELRKAYEYVLSLKLGDRPTWGDIAEVLGKPRRSMIGVASTNVEGDERVPQYPPMHFTDQTLRQLKKLRILRDSWINFDSEGRDALISLIADSSKDESTQAGVAAWEVLNALDEDDLAELDRLELQPGRAAYSLESLRKLTEHMLATGEDLHAARKAVFDVGDDWVPPAEAIGAPVGNPAVDRVLKIIARFLLAAESEWGVPQRVTIEHVREAFNSEAKVREIDRENQKRFKAKLQQRESIGATVKADGRIRESDVRRFEAVQRQNSQCLYCGEPVTFETAEMDHIVPRRGPGSTNTRTNLVAVCVACNRSKSNTPFARWAEKCGKSGVSVKEARERTKYWQRDNGIPEKVWRRFLKEVRDRLEKTDEDPAIDARSMESVAWMANELRDRIAAHFKGDSINSGTKQVFVYKGALTAEARKAAGIEGRVPWIGRGGKSRLDRRHHAVDAAVLTLLDESIARSLAERISVRDTERFRRDGVETWKTYSGANRAAQERFTSWRAGMEQLTDLLTVSFNQDRVVVTENLRLRLGNGRVHDDTIKPMVRRRVGDAFSRQEIDAASTPQLWIALTRDPDFDDREGLPENPARRLRVQGTWYDANDEIPFFDKVRAAIAIRDGWAQLGDSIHHARIYRWLEKGQSKYGMLRVFSADLRRHAHEDLFNVEPHPSWISMRTAHPSIGRSDLSEKEYVGWLVPGDEILVRATESHVAAIGSVNRWKVRGFEDGARFNVEPCYLAKEGLDRFLESAVLEPEDENEVRELVDGKGRRNVNNFFQTARPVIVRRDALGRPRLQSGAGLPVSWSVG